MLRPRGIPRNGPVAYAATLMASDAAAAQQVNVIAAREDGARDHAAERIEARDVVELGNRRHDARDRAVRGGVACVQSISSSATHGRWSDMRAHVLPRGTKADVQRKPRV